MEISMCWCCYASSLMMIIYLTFFFLLHNPYLIVFCIDCFKCVSMNGQNPECDDPFHNNFSSALLESPCKFVVYLFFCYLMFNGTWGQYNKSFVSLFWIGMGGRKGRDGLFPATSCIKIAGYYGLIASIN